MWEALGRAAGEAVRAAMRTAEHRAFVGSLFTGTQEAAVARLRERVLSFDDAAWAEFRQCVVGMVQEAAAHVEQARANDGLGAWGTSFEDRMAQFMAEQQAGGRAAPSAQVREAEQMLAGLQAVLQYGDAFRAESQAASRAAVVAAPATAPPAPAPAPPQAAASDEAEIEAMIDRLAETGTMPDGLLERLGRVSDPETLSRLVEKMKALGADDLGSRPLLDIAEHYVEGDQPYELLWPLAAELPLPFEELDRKTRFHVLWGELSRRLAEGGSLRNAGRLEDAEAAYRECLERADQLGVPVLKAQAYEGLMTVEERRGRRDAASRYLRLSAIEQARQDARAAGGGGR